MKLKHFMYLPLVLLALIILVAIFLQPVARAQETFTWEVGQNIGYNIHCREFDDTVLLTQWEAANDLDKMRRYIEEPTTSCYHRGEEHVSGIMLAPRGDPIYNEETGKVFQIWYIRDREHDYRVYVMFPLVKIERPPDTKT